MGEYFISVNGSEAAFAVSIVGSAGLARKIARVRPAGLCIVCTGEYPEIDVCDIIKNTIARPMIRYLLTCGAGGPETFARRVLLALKENGVDRDRRVHGLPGAPVIVGSVSAEEIAAFRDHVDIVDLAEADDAEAIIAEIRRLSHICPSRACSGCIVREKSAAAVGEAGRCPCPMVTGLDRAGYFLIKPDIATGTLMVEHYYYDRRLLRRIEGENKRAIFRTIIDNGWVTQSSHAGYIWRELNRAEQATKNGLKYIQDVDLLPG